LKTGTTLERDMRAMSEAIEGARDFQGMMEKIEAGAAQQANALRLQQAMQGGTPDERRYTVVPDRQPGENRAAHRARLKAERRARKVAA
jgi:hypothetical protein